MKATACVNRIHPSSAATLRFARTLLELKGDGQSWYPLRWD